MSKNAAGKINNKKWIYVKVPDKEVTEEHYRLDEEVIDAEKAVSSGGKLLMKTIYNSVDPYMRIQQSRKDTWEEPHPLNAVQGGGAVGRVLSVSADVKNFQPGDLIYCYSGWQTHAVVEAKSALKLDENQAPITTALGCLGMPGRTAYFGLLEKGQPKAGETVVVSGAAGAVGSIVAQLARIHGCTVVGIAGKDEKLQWLKKVGIHHAISYRDNDSFEKMSVALKNVAPNGIDVYFDNVGGYITDAVIPQMNVHGRIIICGQVFLSLNLSDTFVPKNCADSQLVSQYSGGLDNPEQGPRFLHHVLYKRLSILGILARDYSSRQKEVVDTLSQYIRDEQLHYRETIVEGFENLPKALNSLFSGANTGKMLVKVDPEYVIPLKRYWKPLTAEELEAKEAEKAAAEGIL